VVPRRFAFLGSRSGHPLFANCRHHLDALFAAPARAPTPRFLHGHEETESRILELEMTKHAPVLPDIGLQKLQHMTKTDDAAGGNL
jgi:hypothetical protein